MRLSDRFNTARGGLKARLLSLTAGMLSGIAGVFILPCLTGCSSFETTSFSGQCFVYPTARFDNSFVNETGQIIAAPQIDSDDSYPPVSMTLTCVSTGATHTWADMSTFDVMDGYDPGEYRVRMSCPIDPRYELVADTLVNLSQNIANYINLTLRPSKSWVEVSTHSSSSDYMLNNIVVHSITSGDYSTIGSRSVESAFVSPDEVEFVGKIVRNSDGKTLNIVVSRPVSLSAGHLYTADVRLDDDILDVKLGQLESRLTLTDALFDTPEPTIKNIGFVSGETFSVTEGVSLAEPVKIDITSGFPLEHIYISVDSPIVALVSGDKRDKAEADLLNLTPEQAELVGRTNLNLTVGDDGCSAEIDFTKSIEGVASLTTAHSSFIIWAVDRYGRASMPAQLDVDTRAVDFEVVSVEDAVFGINEAGVILKPGLPGIEVADIKIVTEMGDQRMQCPITEYKASADGLVTLRFGLPEGADNYDKLPVEVEYMSLPRTSFVVERTVPEFSVVADAYATSARLGVSAADGRVADALVRSLVFYNGTDRCSVMSRDTVSNVITVNGLKPSTRYKLSARLQMMETDLVSTQFTTEAALAIPDGDFEDAVPSVLKYHDLPSGGRYAISPIDMANRQNKVNIDAPWVKKYWASVNGRTFCMDAANPNTWYMQPSSQVVYDAKSGSKAMMIMSVGWDLNGPRIPDYVPEQAYPVPTFSRVVPEVAHRSAGRLFLGKYTFDPKNMTEVMEEGTPFTSRPSSLNGFYKFQPDETVTTDRGSVRVSLISREGGKDTVVAEGYMEFTASPDYTAFNVPLKYHLKDTKPTHLLILFMSSSRGDTVAIDDVNVPVTAFPERGAMQGSVLWVDNLSFTY